MMGPPVEPLVSILLPAFNAEATISACLSSILRQTEHRWECVVVDDGSTDGTTACVRERASVDPRFRLVSLQHGGLVPALNAGLDLCRGAYIARMDADDLMHRSRLERQVALLEARRELDALGCHVRVFPRAGIGPGYREYESWLNAIDDEERIRQELFVECPVAHPGLMFRRRCLKSLAYRDRGWPEDYDLILRLATSGGRIGMLPMRLLCWRHEPGRLSMTDPAYAPERFTELKATFLAKAFLAESDHYVLWGYGGTGRSLRRALEARSKRVSHIVEVHPGRLGNRIHGAPVLAPDALGGLAPCKVIASVAGSVPRQRIREAMRRMGFHEGRDFVCAA
jgi:glycosyltransferase involved in cell wall biosynthesis